MARELQIVQVTLLEELLIARDVICPFVRLCCCCCCACSAQPNDLCQGGRGRCRRCVEDVGLPACDIVVRPPPIAVSACSPNGDPRTLDTPGTVVLKCWLRPIPGQSTEVPALFPCVYCLAPAQCAQERTQHAWLL